MAQICSNEQKRRRFSEREQVYTTIWIVPNSHTWQYYVLMNFRTCPPETCKHSKFDCILPQYGYASQLSTQKTALHGLSSSYKHMPQIGAWLHFETNSHEQRSTPEMSSLYTASSIGIPSSWIMIRYPPIKRGNGKYLINGSF